jgi:hypothetical protein
MPNFDKNPVNKTIKIAARVGFIGLGFFYIALGLLILYYQLKYEKEPGKSTLLRFIDQMSGGEFLLAIMVIGLGAYVFYKFYKGLINPEKGTMVQHLRRIGHFFSVIVYGYFIYLAISLILNKQSQNGGNDRMQLLQTIKDWNIGDFILAFIVVTLILKALDQIYKVATKSFENRLYDKMQTKGKQTFYRIVAIYGLVTRALVIGSLAYFIIDFAWGSEQQKEKVGTSGVIKFWDQIGGDYLVVAIALGLLSYGVFLCFKGFYTNISTHKNDIGANSISG